MPSIRCLHDLDTFPGFFFSPEVLGHQQIVGYQIPPFWLIFRHIYSQSLSFPNSVSSKNVGNLVVSPRPRLVPQQGQRQAWYEAVHEPVEAGGLPQLGGGGANLARGAEAGAQAY